MGGNAGDLAGKLGGLFGKRKRALNPHDINSVIEALFKSEGVGSAGVGGSNLGSSTSQKLTSEQISSLVDLASKGVISAGQLMEKLNGGAAGSTDNGGLGGLTGGNGALGGTSG